LSDNAKPGRAIGVDHVGYVVNDLDAAVAFFINELGFEDLNRRAVMRDDDGDSMSARFDVHPRAVGRYCFLGVGGDKVELLEWTAPNSSVTPPRNSDLCGRHLAIKVDDLDAAAARLSRLDGVTVREPNERGFRYVTTPFGIEIQLIP
jgi:catechol 2,3-dioxygenase-like lactoylglutathione lyase family enzyme